MSELDYDKLLDAASDRLPREIAPPRDLWVGIDHAIEMRANEKKANRGKLFQAVAGLVLVVGMSWFFFADVGLDDTRPGELSPTMLADNIDKGFKVQKANMLAVYEGQPALTLTWREQLQELEVARTNIWQQLKKDPGNVYMIEILLEVQQQQLELIQNVHTKLNRDI